MKIAVSGKGGVGKTTVAALLGKVFAGKGRKVFLVDADPDSNLANALGLPSTQKTLPLSSCKDLIEERTGGRGGGLVKLNPRVEDIPDRYSSRVAGMKLLILGTMSRGGAGCACPENAFLRSLLTHLVLERDDVVIVDMEAGLEHLGRATVEGIDALLVVVEPGSRSIETAKRTLKLASDIGLERVLALGNKVRGPLELKFIESSLGAIPLVGYLAYHPEIAKADLEGKSVLDSHGGALNEAALLVERLEALCAHAESPERLRR